MQLKMILALLNSLKIFSIQILWEFKDLDGVGWYFVALNFIF
jgi:hypothetical protein